MSSTITKKILKSAKEALSAQNYEWAKEQASQVLEVEPSNYHALIFRGVACQHLNETSEALSSFHRAQALDRKNMLAYQGIVSLYEHIKDPENTFIALKSLFELLIELKEVKKAHDTLARMQSCASTKTQRMEVLRSFLPESSSYPVLFNPSYADQSSIPPPKVKILSEIIALQRDLDQEAVISMIAKQKNRLGAPPLAQLKAQVEAEVAQSSPLGILYEQLTPLLLDSTEAVAIASAEIDPILQDCLQYIRLKHDLALQSHDHSLASSVLNRGMSLANSLISISPSSLLPYEFILDRQLYPMKEYPVTLIRSILDHLSTPSSPSSSSYQAALVLSASIYQKLVIEPAVLDPESIEHFKSILNGLDQPSIFSHVTLCLALYSLKSWSFLTEHIITLKKCLSKRGPGLKGPVDHVLVELEEMLGLTYLSLPGHESTEEALTIFSNLSASHPRCFDYIYACGQAYLSLARFSKAICAFDQALALVPSHQACILERAWALFLNSKLESADKRASIVNESMCQFQEFLKRDATNATVQYRLGRIYWEAGGEYQTKKSFSYFHLLQSAKLDPSAAPPFSLMGEYFRLIECDNDRAMKCYLKALLLNPGDEDSALALSSLYIDDVLYTPAIEILERFVKVSNRCAWAHQRLGFLHLQKAHALPSISAFQCSLKVNVDDAATWLGLGQAYLLAGRYSSAIKALKRALDLDTKSLDVHYYLAKAHAGLGEQDESLKVLARMLELSKDDPSPRFLIGYDMAHYSHELGVKLFYQQKYAESAEMLVNALTGMLECCSLNPCSIRCLVKLGHVCMEFCTLVPSFGRLLPASEIANFLAASSAAANNSKLASFLAIADPDKHNIPVVNMVMLIKCAAVAFHSCIALSLQSEGQRNSSFLASCNSNIASAAYTLHWLMFKTRQNELSTERKESEGPLQLCLNYAVAAVRQCPSDTNLWNALGVFSMHEDPLMSQNALIKAIKLAESSKRQSSSASAWSNLGMLYYIQHEVDLALECFKKAQSADPEYPLAWLGQLMVARSESAANTNDLAEHCFTIFGSCIPEFSLQYAWFKVTEAQVTIGGSSLSDALFGLSLVLATSFSPDPYTLNLYGCGLERHGSYSSAMEAYQKAYTLAGQLSVSSERVAVKQNYARCLLINGQYSQAEAMYTDLVAHSEDPLVLLGAALSSASCSDLESSAGRFAQCLALVSSSSSCLTNDIHYVACCVLYNLGGAEYQEVAKQELFQCIQNDPSYLPAILALGEFGFEVGDMELVQSSIAELLKVETGSLPLNSRSSSRKWALITRFSIAAHDIEGCKDLLLQAIQARPADTCAWASFLLLLGRFPRLKDDAVLSVLANIPLDNEFLLIPGCAIAYALHLFGCGDVVGADNVLMQSVHRRPDQFWAWIILYQVKRALLAKSILLSIDGLESEAQDEDGDNLGLQMWQQCDGRLTTAGALLASECKKLDALLVASLSWKKELYLQEAWLSLMRIDVELMRSFVDSKSEETLNTLCLQASQALAQPLLDTTLADSLKAYFTLLRCRITYAGGRDKEGAINCLREWLISIADDSTLSELVTGGMIELSTWLFAEGDTYSLTADGEEEEEEEEEENRRQRMAEGLALMQQGVERCEPLTTAMIPLLLKLACMALELGVGGETEENKDWVNLAHASVGRVLTLDPACFAGRLLQAWLSAKNVSKVTKCLAPYLMTEDDGDAGSPSSANPSSLQLGSNGLRPGASIQGCDLVWLQVVLNRVNPSL